MAVLPCEATEAAVVTVASSCKIRMFPGTPLQESCKESSSAIFKLRDPKELAKLSTDIPQIALRDQKELATEVTSKKLCRHVWLVTSVD
jgi:hypothetical protein